MKLAAIAFMLTVNPTDTKKKLIKQSFMRMTVCDIVPAENHQAINELTARNIMSNVFILKDNSLLQQLFYLYNLLTMYPYVSCVYPHVYKIHK